MVFASHAIQSAAQDRVESIQEIPYELLNAHADTIIDFEAHLDWTTLPRAINSNVFENGVRIATRFKGQSIVAQRSNTIVDIPLALAPLAKFTDTEKAAAFYEPDGFRTISGYIRRSPYLPLAIGGVGRQPANMLSGFSTRQNGKVLTSLSPRLQLRSDGNWEDHSVVGIEPIALMFETDQTALGFTLVSLNRDSQNRFVGSTMYETLVQLKFFRRDGSLISELEFSHYQTAQFAFARCGETYDIAGIQISNSSQSGLAIDDITFGLSPAMGFVGSSDGPLTQPHKGTAPDNPLEVDLCTFYTS